MKSDPRRVIELGQENVPLDQDWANKNARRCGAPLDYVDFRLIVEGSNERDWRTRERFQREGFLGGVPVVRRRFLSDPSTHCDGKIHPPDVLPDFGEITDKLIRFICGLAEKYDVSTLLLIGGGAKKIVLRGLAEGRVLRTQEDVTSWHRGDVWDWFGPGETSYFRINPATQKIELIEWEDMPMRE